MIKHHNNLVNKTSQVERTFGFWKYGSAPVDDDKISFSGDNFSSRTKLFMDIAKKMTSIQWNKVMSSATEYISKYDSTRSRSASPAFVQEDDDEDEMGVDMAALDEDSDLDV